MRKYYLYALYDPNLRIPKYIGISNNPQRRYLEHLEDESITKKTKWIKSLIEENKKPVLKVIKDTDNVRVVIKWEIKCIAKLKDKYQLTNTTAGGEYYGIGTPISVFDLNGNYLECFNSMTEYTEIHNLNINAVSSISACCQRRRNFAYNRMFRYAGDIVTKEDLIKYKEALHKRDSKHFYIISVEGKLLGEFESLQEAEKQGFGPQNVLSEALRDLDGHNSVNGNLICYNLEDYNYKLEKYRIGRTKGKKVILSKYDLSGNYIDTYYSYTDAVNSVEGKNQNLIKDCCEGKYSKAYDYQWRFGDSKENIGIYKKKYNSSKRYKKVCQYDLNNNFIKEWNSSKEAGEALNIRPANINQAANGQKKTAAGYIWRYSNAVV